jgi:hypothetical protein
MVRIFAQLEDVGSEYETLAPVSISLTPFKENCVCLDLEDDKIYNTVMYEAGEEDTYWKPYNIVHFLGEYVKNIKTGELLGPIVGWCMSGKGTIVDLEDGTEIKITNDLITGMLYQKYENGQPIGEPYFE